MPRVAIKNVSYSDPAAYARDVYRAFRDAGASHEAALLLVAHTAVATGWGRSMDNYMLAGIKAGPSSLCEGQGSSSKPFICLRGCERQTTNTEGPLKCWTMAWVAFPNLRSSAAAVLKLLQAPRYKQSFQYLQAGDPRYFAQLGKDGWYTDSQTRMDKSMRSTWARAAKYVGEQTGSSGSILAPIAIGLALGTFLFRSGG